MKKEPHIFVEDTINNALKDGASDIFFLPQSDNIKVRTHVDGIQNEIAELPPDYGQMCTAHLKALASLLTYRTKISQDGVIRKFNNVELRVSTLPTICGERISIRVIRDNSSEQYLSGLNLQSEIEEELRKMILRPNGLTILTGPTGSGKTTTIYAMIRELLRTSQDPASIITIEDPVECAINGISQISVSKSDNDWNYPQALRAALRQDVKTLIIGEMRDREVVKVALDAALSGHRVITTYHAGDIPSLFARMLHQGFEPFLIAASLAGVVTQRLVQANGQKERIPVAATLLLNDEWRDFIAENPPLCEIRKKVSETPYGDIIKNAEELAKQGIITEHWKLEI